MRFYVKLLGMILIAVGAQSAIEHYQVEAADFRFGMRYFLAQTFGSQQDVNRLIEEAGWYYADHPEAYWRHDA